MTVIWWISSNECTDPMPTSFPHIVLAKLLLLLLLLQLLQNCYCCYRYYCYCYHCYQNYHITMLLITLLEIFNLQVWLNWQINCQYLQIFIGSPYFKSINLGWILYPRILLRSPILVGYQDLFLVLLPGSIAIFFESLGIIINLSLWRIWRMLRLRFILLRQGAVRNCHLALL